jgi:hypothetical protein
MSNYVALLFNMIRISLTPQKSSGFYQTKRKKVGSKCVARHPLTEYIAGVSKRRVLSRG